MASMKDANFEVVFQEEFFFSMEKVLTEIGCYGHERLGLQIV